jgi:hypothetical protein
VAKINTTAMGNIEENPPVWRVFRVFKIKRSQPSASSYKSAHSPVGAAEGSGRVRTIF